MYDRSVQYMYRFAFVQLIVECVYSTFVRVETVKEEESVEEGMEYSHCCQAGWGGVECVDVHYRVKAMYRCRDSSSTRSQEPV